MSPPAAQIQSLQENFFSLSLANSALNESAFPSFFANRDAARNIGIKVRKPVINQLIAACMPTDRLKYGVRYLVRSQK